jgi:hypothetical protein
MNRWEMFKASPFVADVKRCAMVAPVCVVLSINDIRWW